MISKVPWRIFPVDAYGKRIGKKLLIREWEWKNGQLFAKESFIWKNNKKKSLKLWCYRIEHPWDHELWIGISVGENDQATVVPSGGEFKLEWVKVGPSIANLILEYEGHL